MPNNTVSDWSTTPTSNTEVGGVDLAENSMRPRDVNNAIRTVMAQIASGILAWPTTTIELGHATDTTLSRGAAGFMAVEGKRVPSPGSQAAGDILYRGSTEWERLAKGTALQVLRQNSALTAPEWATAREVLSANRTYYVRTDGSDSNNGLANTAGGAFLTLQKAWNVALGLDLGGFAITVSVGAGTFAAGITGTTPLVGGSLTVTGAGATTIISTTTASCFRASGGAAFTVGSVKMEATSGDLVAVTSGGMITIGTATFGATSGNHMRSDVDGSIIAVYGSAWTVDGNAAFHMWALGGTISVDGVAITLSGTRTYTTWAVADFLGRISAFGYTFSGSATATRYSATQNAMIKVFGGGATYFPGGTAGSTATGGIYA